MAMCLHCSGEMTEVTKCITREITLKGIRQSKYKTYTPVLHCGTRCHDCGVTANNFHHPGCDMERCPNCGGQFVSCDCRKKR